MGHPPERLRWTAALDAAHSSTVEGKHQGPCHSVPAANGKIGYQLSMLPNRIAYKHLDDNQEF